RPVHSVAILLRPRADAKQITGVVDYEGRAGKQAVTFCYQVVRVWEEPAEQFLAGGLGTLPVAVLGKLSAGLPVQDALAPVVERLVGRLFQEAPTELARKLVLAAYILTGLRVSKEIGLALFRKVEAMHESTTYQAILEEGEERGRTAGVRR